MEKDSSKDPYAIESIRKSLEVVYKDKARTPSSFYAELATRIDVLSSRHPTAGTKLVDIKDGVFTFSDEEDSCLIFKMQVRLYGRAWALYFSSAQYVQLAKDLRFSLDPAEKLAQPDDLAKIPTAKPGELPALAERLGPELAAALVSFLQTASIAKNLKTVLEFLGISRPFCEQQYEKVVELWCENKTSELDWSLGDIVSSEDYESGWLVLTRVSAMRYEASDAPYDAIKSNLDFDSSSRIAVEPTGLWRPNGKMELKIRVSLYDLILRSPDRVSGLLYLHHLVKLMFYSPYCLPNRFGSFAPVRIDNETKLYSDGKEYFQDLYDQLEQAQHSIFITDWYFAPQTPLVRYENVDIDQNKSRIDHVLCTAAKERNVKVFILVYKEVPGTLGNDSEQAQEWMEALDPNIKVLRHPNWKTIFWSHHEKLVVVDKQVVFMGGLDICWGRWDTNDHPLFNENNMFPGLDYYNPLKEGISKGSDYHQASIPQTYPRLPWHDVSFRLTGPIVQDFVYHFTCYWNFARVSLGREELAYSIINPNSSEGHKEIREQVDPDALDRFLHPERDDLRRQDEELAAFIEKKIAEASRASDDQEKTVAAARYTSEAAQAEQTASFKFVSNNISSYVLPTDSAATQNPGPSKVTAGEELHVVRVQREAAAKRLAHKSAITAEQTQGATAAAVSRRAGDLPVISSEAKHLKPALAGTLKMQALRSSAKWSLGKQDTETSIMSAYLDLIKNSKQFIFIENQFFVSSTSDQGVKNEIVQCLVDRILKAHKENAQFKVVIFIPGMPSFKDHLDQEKGMSLQIQIGLQNETISKSPRSLLNQLRAGLQGSSASPDDYLLFCCLRKWQMSPVPMLDTQKPDEPAKPRPITEIIYIHTKLMIVDDCKLICGSANLNDRSMLGDRDSEIAVYMEGAEDYFVTDTTTNQKVAVNQQIHDFRRALFKEHFGAGVDIKWPTIGGSWEKMWQIAETNTKVYEEVFKVYPSNLYPDFTGLVSKDTFYCDEKLFEEQKAQISGSAVLYAYDFLKDVDLFNFKFLNKVATTVLFKIFQ